jgi:hypothetical protein
VARYGVLLAAPFASPEVVAAEELLFAYIKAELGVEQPQLLEHLTYGLPDLQSTCSFLKILGMEYQVYPSGYVHAWLAMMFAKHNRLSGNLDFHEQLDAYYSRFFGPDERREPAYRHLLVVACDKRNEWLASVDIALTPTIRNSHHVSAPKWTELTTWLIQLLGLRLQEQGIHMPLQTIALQSQTIAILQQEVARRDAQINDLEQRASWLEEQYRKAHQNLAAVEQGRVIRLLNWIQRQWQMLQQRSTR